VTVIPKDHLDLDLGDLAEQRRDTALENAAFDWSRCPESLQPGQFRLRSDIALAAGLEPGTVIDADQFGKLLIKMHLPKQNKKSKVTKTRQ